MNSSSNITVELHSYSYSAKLISRGGLRKLGGDGNPSNINTEMYNLSGWISTGQTVRFVHPSLE
jgi:hypothetical protein